jgi:hypothetical protein
MLATFFFTAQKRDSQEVTYAPQQTTPAWVEQKNWGTKKKMGPKQRRSEPLTKEAPYKPYAGKPPVRFCAGGAR